jgi:hypothetical protein
LDHLEHHQMTTLSRIVTGGEALHFNEATFRRVVQERGELLAALHALEAFLREEDIALPSDLLEQCGAAIAKAVQS